MAPNPIAPLFEVVVTVGPYPDPALDASHTNYDEVIAEYRKTREIKLLEKITLAGKTLTRFQCKAMRSVDVKAVQALNDIDTRPETLPYFIFAASCHSIARPGAEPLVPDDEIKPWGNREFSAPKSYEKWTQVVVDEYGAPAVEEVASVVMQRARLPKSATGPYSLPGELARAR